jgi:hypothetical protein
VKAQWLAQQVIAESRGRQFRPDPRPLRTVEYQSVDIRQADSGILAGTLGALEPHLGLNPVGQIPLLRLVDTGYRHFSPLTRHFIPSKSTVFTERDARVPVHLLDQKQRKSQYWDNNKADLI